MYVCGKKYDNQNMTFLLKELFMLEFNNFAPDVLALINNSLFEHFIFRYKRIIL